MKHLTTSVFLALFILLTIQGQAQSVPDFEFQDLANEYRSFEELRGQQATLIDFWTTWCRPCKKAIPELNKIYDEYKEQGVEIIGINCDGPRTISKVGPVSNALQIKYPVLLDINTDLMNTLSLTTFPSLILVDGSGKIQYVHEGFVSGDELEIKEELEKVLSQN